MQANNQIGSFDEILDAKYGKIGSKQREDFHKEAYAYCVGEMIKDARKQEHVTQEALAERVGTNKSYISRIEKKVIKKFGCFVFYYYLCSGKGIQHYIYTLYNVIYLMLYM